ncbi:MAG: MBL fold metallo-hydrolase [Candidatus Bathyarchaeota archaeon B63]|nr:MAG: MBL fold metallo-hydrolase [Candidatus Bathyarchaeota archaeon B63]
MVELIFLGTGGGRFATITQRAKTGGIRLISEEVNMHIDPGPGALIYSLELGLNPQKINAILISHSHLDHTNDAGILIEAMTRGGRTRRGLLAASRSVLKGNEVCDRAISNYHRELPERVIEAEVGSRFEVGDLSVEVGRAVHADPDTVGFRFEIPSSGAIGYLPDSEYFDGLSEFYSGVRLLILSVLRPSGQPWKGHMTTDDAARVADEVKPEMLVITHFGMMMIMKSPSREAKLIEEKTGVPTVAARYGMRILMKEKIRMGEPKRQADLSLFMGN